MTHLELQQIQKRLNFNGPDMSACLGIDYNQYRRLYYGHTAIPSNIARAAMELEQINNSFMAGLPARVDQRVRMEYPNGMIPGDYAE